MKLQTSLAVQPYAWSTRRIVLRPHVATVTYKNVSIGFLMPSQHRDALQQLTPILVRSP